MYSHTEPPIHWRSRTWRREDDEEPESSLNTHARTRSDGSRDPRDCAYWALVRRAWGLLSLQMFLSENSEFHLKRWKINPNVSFREVRTSSLRGKRRKMISIKTAIHAVKSVRRTFRLST